MDSDKAATEQGLTIVDANACDRIASIIARKTIPPDQEDSALPGLPKHLIGNFFLSLVAICHQTSPRGRPPLEGIVGGRHLRGWDYLSAKLEIAASYDHTMITPIRLAQISTADIREIFADVEFGERLTEPNVRAELLRDVGAQMMFNRWDAADDIYRQCEGRVLQGTPNLLNTLRHFLAYSDPVRKKPVFFLALMRNSGLWHYVDNEAVGPPVDYHEVRGHLRIGTVRITDEVLRNKVICGQEVTKNEDIAIRQAVYDAIMRISKVSGLHNPSQLHYLFWNVFRSICTRESPQCFALRQSCSLPSRYLPVTNTEYGSRSCPFAPICASAGETAPITEHVFETSFY